MHWKNISKTIIALPPVAGFQTKWVAGKSVTRDNVTTIATVRFCAVEAMYIHKNNPMNRTIFIAAVSLISFAANSQITKGNWLVGGSISYSSTNYNSINFGIPHTSYDLQVRPNIGYFFADKIAGGIAAGISKIGDRDRGQSYTDFNIGPYFRYYLLSFEKEINIVTEAAYLYGFEKGSTPDKAPKNTFSFSGGPVFYFNSSVGLEMLVSYATYKYSSFEGSNNTIRFGIGLQVHLDK